MKKFNRSRFKAPQFNSVLTVTAAECGSNADRMVRKFIKKVKKEGILDEARERQYFKKPTTVRSERKRSRKRLIQKLNKQRTELLIATNKRKKRS